MKGAITSCLAQLVESQFGKEKWKAIRRDAGSEFAPGLRLPTADVEDATAQRLLQSTCKVLGLTLAQAADAFGEYWCCSYAPKIYHSYLKRFTNAREMILEMDQVHSDVTRNMSNARPPRFEYNWESERALVVTYKSARKMIDIYVGLARGVGKYFKEPLDVQKLSDTQCRIEFLQ